MISGEQPATAPRTGARPSKSQVSSLKKRSHKVASPISIKRRRSRDTLQGKPANPARTPPEATAQAKRRGTKLQRLSKTNKSANEAEPQPCKPSRKKSRGKKRGRGSATASGSRLDDGDADVELSLSKRRREGNGNVSPTGDMANSPRTFYETLESFLEANKDSWQLLKHTKVESEGSKGPCLRTRSHANVAMEAKASVRWFARDGRQLCILPARIDDINAFLGGKKYIKLKLEAQRARLAVASNLELQDTTAQGRSKDGRSENRSVALRSSIKSTTGRPPRPELVKGLKCSHLSQACATNDLDCARAIMRAAKARGANALQRVLSSSADVKHGFLPVHVAAFAGQLPMLMLLVEEFGADINVAAWKTGLTPIMIAARGGLVDSASWMMRKGAKLGTRTTGKYKDDVKSGMCALDLAHLIPNEDRRNRMVAVLSETAET